MSLNKKLTTFNAAEYCDVSFMTINRWIADGKIKAHKTPGGHRRIFKEDLQKFMLKNNIPIPEGDLIINKKILIVDDDVELRESLEEYLKERYFEVFTAGDGYEACFVLNKQLPDFIILDLIMPNMDGFRVCELIKEDSRTKDLKLIVLTGYANEENIKRAYEFGVDKVLSKPVKIEDLLDIIYEMI
ncbi:response regulator [candidate division KSB1 bacterium]